MIRSFSGVLRSKHLLLDRASLSVKGIAQWKRGIITTSASVAAPKPVVVFDIDDTICASKYNRLKHEFSDEHVLDNGGRYHTLPHFKSIFNYLLSKNVRIVIFSAGTEVRNLELIQKICARTFCQDHKNLILNGQFELFSRHQLTSDSSSNKDLMVVLKPDEQLENCVLVDDYIWCRKPGQEANFILVPEIIGFENFGFYFLGLFKSYFESESSNVKPISQFMSEHIRMVASGNHDPNSWDPRQQSYLSIQFILDMVKIGLNEVRKTEPAAEFYDYDKFIDRVVNRADDCGHGTIDKYTKLPIVVNEPFYLMKSKVEIYEALMRFHAEHL